MKRELKWEDTRDGKRAVIPGAATFDLMFGDYLCDAGVKLRIKCTGLMPGSFGAANFDTFYDEESAIEYCQDMVNSITEEQFLRMHMDPHQLSVREFMRGAGQPVRDTPGMPDEDWRVKQARIMLEETWETITQGLGLSFGMAIDDSFKLYFPMNKDQFKQCLTVKPVQEPNLSEATDGVADEIYTRLGLANMMGVAIQPIMGEVCKNNLEKLGKGEMVDGKLIKPEGHVAPDISGLLKEQGWEG